MATARVRLWLAKVDDTDPKQLKWALRDSGALSILVVEVDAGSVPKMVLGSFWRDQTPQYDYSMADEIVVKDTYIGPQSWDLVYATDRVGTTGLPRVGDDEYPLIGEDARGSELRFQSSPLLRCYTESGMELLIPCYEVFRRFYALTTELANAILAGFWPHELAKLVDVKQTRFAEDDEVFEVCPIVDMRDIGCMGIAYFMTMPQARKRVAEIYLSLANARRAGQSEPWIVAQPPWSDDGLSICFVGKQLRSGAVLVSWIYSTPFPHFPHPVVRIETNQVVMVLSEDATPSPPSKELQVRIDELSEATIEPSADARLSRAATHFEINESWKDLVRITRRALKRTYVTLNPDQDGEKPTKRKRRFTTGHRSEGGRLPTASLSSDAQNAIVNRFSALARCFESLLKNKDICKREDYALVNLVQVGEIQCCSFPTQIGNILRPWALVNFENPRPRLCWVSEITALDGSHCYWFEVETDAHAVKPEHFRALVVKPRMPNARLEADTLESILKTGVLEKAQWKKAALQTAEEKVFWVSATHKFASGQVTNSLVLGKLEALGVSTKRTPGASGRSTASPRTTDSTE